MAAPTIRSRPSSPSGCWPALRAAHDRVLDVSRRGGRVLVRDRAAGFAAARCTSTSPAWRRPPAARCSTPVRPGPIRAAGRASVRLWWIGGVAALTDGDALLADPGDRRDRRAACSPCPIPTSWSPTAGSPAARCARGSRWSRWPISTRSRSGVASASRAAGHGRPVARAPARVGVLRARSRCSRPRPRPRPPQPQRPHSTAWVSCAYAPRSDGERGQAAWRNRFRASRFLTVQEVAELMRVSSMTVYRLIKAGDLPAVRVGRSFRVRDVDVDTYLGQRYTQ